MTVPELEERSWKLRRDILDIVISGGAGHIGGDMSVLNSLLVLYKNHLRITPETAGDPDRDRFVLSKGHAVEAYYAVLADCGFLKLEEVRAGFSKFGSPYIGHPNNKLKGIEMNSGSLGHGLSVCVGMALAGRMDQKDYRVYTIMGDGELAEGSVWEAAMAASSYRLDNLCAVIDRNGLQISGPTEEVMRQEDLAARWRAFGWQVLSVDGDSIAAVDRAYTEAKTVRGKPTVIIAATTKGRGSPLMEGRADWHHRVPTAREYERIRADFEAGEEAVSHV